MVLGMHIDIDGSLLYSHSSGYGTQWASIGIRVAPYRDIFVSYGGEG